MGRGRACDKSRPSEQKRARLGSRRRAPLDALFGLKRARESLIGQRDTTLNTASATTTSIKVNPFFRWERIMAFEGRRRGRPTPLRFRRPRRPLNIDMK